MVLVAKDIMDANVLELDESTDALTCARTMATRHKGYAVVTRSGAIAGIVTEWDFLAKVVATEQNPAKLLLREIATPKVDSCAPDTPTDQVVAEMAGRGIRRMVVRSGDRVLGVITSRDVLANFRQYVDKVSSDIASYQSQATPLG